MLETRRVLIGILRRVFPRRSIDKIDAKIDKEPAHLIHSGWWRQPVSFALRTSKMLEYSLDNRVFKAIRFVG